MVSGLKWGQYQCDQTLLRLNAPPKQILTGTCSKSLKDFSEFRKLIVVEASHTLLKILGNS